MTRVGAMTRRSRGLRPVGADFADTAPVRLSFAARMAAAPEEVYRALADEVEAWPRWFRVVTLARPVEREGRDGHEVHLMGTIRFLATVMVAVPQRRYAYRIDGTNVPGLHAMLEDWRLSPVGGGTILQWRIGVDGPLPGLLAVQLARPLLHRAFRDAVRALDRRLSAA
ncbi:SRPBCC family protein [Streptomyces sp. NPDC049555]|uniref:SRPBCC family protein n=1 Tax=unclassified Streptomyces TaxID=2593676 RepID=UPI00343F4C8D